MRLAIEEGRFASWAEATLARLDGERTDSSFESCHPGTVSAGIAALHRNGFA